MTRGTMLAPHIISLPGVRQGRPVIAEKGVLVEFVAELHEARGETVGQICAGYGLEPAEVHAALAYYFDHRLEIDERVRRDREEIERQAREDPSPFFERMKSSGRLA